MNKTERKNKTNLAISYPDPGTYWTINDLSKRNPNCVLITLRVKLDNAIKKENRVSVIGFKKNAKGRPSLVLSTCPVSSELLTKAYADGIMPPENFEDPSRVLVPVTNVTTSSSQPDRPNVANTTLEPLSA